MITPGELQTVLGTGPVSNLPERFEQISIDSRRIGRNTLFIAIKGDKYDGHQFVFEALAAGAGAAVVEIGYREAFEERLTNLPVYYVESSLEALHKIAAYYRRKINPTVVAVTGSNGKTSTKDMIYSIVCHRFNALKNHGNYNNQIGLPLTLLELKPKHEIAIVEHGINMPGEQDILCGISQPDIGLITNIGYAHLERLGDLDGVFAEKRRLFNYVKKSVINADDPYLKGAETGCERVSFGIENPADVTGEINGSDLKLQTAEGGVTIHMAAAGRHDCYNALAAATVALELGVDLLDIKNGLQRFQPAKMRMEPFRLKNGIEIFNDSYNANPSSAVASIEQFCSSPCCGKRIVIMGSMLELGGMAEQLHLELGRFIAGQRVSMLLTYGDVAGVVADGALDAGMSRHNVLAFSSMVKMNDSLMDILEAGDIVLIKGSRGMRMERVFEFISAHWKMDNK